MKRLLLTLMLASACGVDGGSSDGGPRELDADLVACFDEGALTLGRCVDVSGVPCNGGEVTTNARYDELPLDGAITPVIGPQGSTMFALAVRAADIAPGDPEEVFSPDNPIVEVTLIGEEEGEVVAAYRGRAGFRPVEGMDGTFENPQVFIVVDEAAATLRGHRFRVEAHVTDSRGERRCGTVEIEAS